MIFRSALVSMAVCITASVTALASDSFTGDIPSYLEQAESGGISHIYDGPWENFVGGGVATFDCNGDRFPEVFIAGGVNDSALFVNHSQAAGELRFKRDESEVTQVKQVIGAYPVNLDNDQWTDLVLLRLGQNLLLKGLGDCQFANANASFGFDGGSDWSTAFAVSYFGDDQFPTFAIGNYVDRSAPGSPWGTCSDNLLYRPLVNEKGEVTYSEPQLLSPGHCALSMLFTDWNRSGVDSLRITNDRQYHRGGEEQLWKIDSQYPRLYSRADGWQRLVIWGMGIAEADLNGDGFPEYALTSMGDTKLQTVDVQQAIEESRPVYEDVGFARGATAHRPYTGNDLKPSTGWHAEFADVNNDTLLDLFIAKGNVERMKDFAAYDPDNLLLGTHNGGFKEHGDQSGIALDRRGRGAAIADFNADGLMDLLVVNRSAPVSLFRHSGFKNTPVKQNDDSSNDHSQSGSHQSSTRQGGNWLMIELNQRGANRHAIGASLSIKTGNVVQTRRVNIGGGHASGQTGFIHVGLGVAERATVRVQWPDGEWSAAFRVFANQFAVISRGDEKVGYWYPPAEVATEAESASSN